MHHAVLVQRPLETFYYMSILYDMASIPEKRASDSSYVSTQVYTSVGHECEYMLSSFKPIKVVFHLLPTQDGPESGTVQARS